jgi:hypothetical protein
MGGKGKTIDYAVKMRRFPQEALLGSQPLSAALIERLAEVLAAFHGRIPSVGNWAPYGSPHLVAAPMRENFRQLRVLVPGSEDLQRLADLETWTESHFAELEGFLAERREQGWIRECHGDMHLGNIALVEGRIVVFDCIEFNPSLRWIDTMSEVAFLVMDLMHAGRKRLARRFLDRYLEVTGDYAGLRVLLFYQVYRAMVRAKVTAIRLAQPDLEQRDREPIREELLGYLELAEGFIRTRRPALIITCGVSASGKSTLAAILSERLPGVRIRSDVERKRLFALDAGARTGAGLDQGIYAPAATEATYRRLLELAETVVSAGETAIVDASFLKRSQRRPFRALADARGLPFLTLLAQAPESLLRARVEQRLSRGSGPSEATQPVLDAQLATREPPDARERRRTLVVDTALPLGEDKLLALCRRSLAEP